MRATQAVIKKYFEDGLLEQNFTWPRLSEYMRKERSQIGLRLALLVSCLPAKDYCISGGQDGTGEQTRNFFQYCKDRLKQMVRAAKQAKASGDVQGELREVKDKDLDENRYYVMSTPWLFYETNLVPCVGVYRHHQGQRGYKVGSKRVIYTDKKPRSEVQFWLPHAELVETFFPNFKQAVGDKGQFQYANYLHAKVNEYDVHIDPKKDINPSRPESDRRSRNAAKAKFDDYRDNPDAHRTARGRRNVQEGRHNGYKLTQGGGLTMKSEAGQDAQVIVKNIVENIRQLHVLTFQYGFAINFRHEAKLVELKGGLPDFNDLIEKFSGTSGDQAIVDLATKRALEVPQETA